MATLESLEVWKRSASLSAQIFTSLSSLKDFGFKDQITRSGLSIPSNIAEGFERDSYKEFANFLKYAKGSAGELKTQINIGIEVGYIKKETGKEWLKELDEIAKMLGALRINTKRKSETRS